MPAGTEWRVQRQVIAEVSGWPLEIVDRMSVQDVTDFLAVREARQKAAPTPKKIGRGRRR